MDEESKLPMIFMGIIILIVIVGAIFGVMALSSSGSKDSNNTSQSEVKAVVEQDGTQVIEMTAKGGYKPNKMTASADKPILLKVITNGTYDCSSSIYIPKIGVNKNLPATGTTEIQIPAQKLGTSLDITCSMGMYRAKLNIV